ncbi:MAG: hypothetical protein OHK0017_11700 [Patescibacteria group bacterium]
MYNLNEFYLKMTILLLGIMGSGKTTVGQIISQKLSLDFYEQDLLTLERSGFDSIFEAFNERLSDWKMTELEVSRELSYQEDQVIACSGGIIENELNLLYFKENCPELHTFYLYASPDVLLDRLATRTSSSNENQNLEDLEAKINKVFFKRDFLYRDYTDDVVDTDSLSPATAAEFILDSIRNRRPDWE